MLTVFAAVAELEREYILQRQREGITIAKEQGKYRGRPPKEHPNLNQVFSLWRNGTISAASAMKQLRVSKTQFYRLAKKYLSGQIVDQTYKIDCKSPEMP